MKTYQLYITGKVQGVWYRASAKDKALELGLRGRVWNNPDHSVGAEVQGDEPAVQEFIAWCKVGPQLARVENVSVSVSDSDAYNNFAIARD